MFVSTLFPDAPSPEEERKKNEYPRYYRAPSHTGVGPAPSRRSINTASKKTNGTLQAAAAGARAALIFGRVQVTAKLGVIKPISGSIQPTGMSHSYKGLAMQCIWGLGELTAIESVSAAGAQVIHDSGGAYLQNYVGSSSQGADPLLSALIDGYTDTCVGSVLGRTLGLAYSVLTTTQTSVPRVTAILKGPPCYDPRTDSTAYTTNPALQLAFLLDYLGETVDWTGSEAAFDYCDESVAGQSRWICCIAFDSPQAPDAAIELLRGYAHCMLARGADGIRLVPDAPVSVSGTITASDIVSGTFQAQKARRADMPTVVSVGYTLPSSTAGATWNTQRRAFASIAGVSAGTEPWRESALQMPGIQSYNEAFRFATERLNGLRLRDLSGSCTVFDEGLVHQIGDVVALTHPLGLAAKSVRLLDMQSDSPGRWALTWQEYDAAVYSDSTVSEPSTPDTSLPDPFDVPAVTDLAAVEEVYQQRDGSYSSRLRITWTSDDYPYDRSYRVTVSTEGVQVWTADSDQALYVTGPLQEGKPYVVNVVIVAAVGITGIAAETSVTAQGRNLPPGDVATLSGFEVGGQVRLSWVAAIDIDIRWYEIRRLATASVTGTDSTDWAAAEVIDRFDGLRATVYDTPSGAYTFFVKALDSVGNYSANPAKVAVDVTLDTRAFFVGQEIVAYSAANSTAIYASVIPRARQWSEQGTVVDTLLTSIADTYTDPFFALDDGGASEWISESWDVGAVYSGTWKADWAAITAMVGSVTKYLELSTDGSSWTSYEQDAKVATARYARVRAACSSGSALLADGDVTLRLDVVAQEETGSGTTDGTGKATISLDRTYTYAKAISVTPQGTSGLMAVVDNVDPSSGFDVWIFDSTGAAAASIDFFYRFLGV